MTTPYQSIVDVWNDRHADALEMIEACYNDPNEEVRSLSRFLIDHQENAYSFLPSNLAGRLFYSEGASGLLQSVRHALTDDGEICFVLVGSCPMLDLCHIDEIDRNRLESEAQRVVAKARGRAVALTPIPDASSFLEIARGYLRMLADRSDLHHESRNARRGDDRSVEADWTARQAADFRDRSEAIVVAYEAVVGEVLHKKGMRIC